MNANRFSSNAVRSPSAPCPTVLRPASPTRLRPAQLVLAAGSCAVAAALLFAGGVRAQASAAGSTAPSPAGSTAAQQSASALSPATVRMIQHSLIQGGYAVDAADGVWGPTTEAAVREFQRVKGLEASGRPDRKTLEALGVTAEGAAGRSAQQQPAAGGTGPMPPVQARRPTDLDRETIKAIQRALDKQGLQVGQADGIWGERTTSAIANFQRARGVPASGEPDAYTLAALGLLPAGSRAAEAWRSSRPPGPQDLDPAAVRLIQQSLRERGFEVAVDGMWGDRTVDALRDFQRRQGFEPMGEPDVHTLAALGLLPGSGSVPATGRSR